MGHLACHQNSVAWTKLGSKQTTPTAALYECCVIFLLDVHSEPTGQCQRKFEEGCLFILYLPHAFEPSLGNRGDLSINSWTFPIPAFPTEMPAKKSIHPWGGRPQDGEGVPANMLQLSHTPNPVLNGTNVNFLFPDQTI